MRVAVRASSPIRAIHTKQMSNMFSSFQSSRGRPSRRRALLFTAAALASTALVLAEPAPTLPDSPTRLSSNENAFGYAARAREAMIQNLDAGSYYNRNEIETLVALCAKREGVPTDYILTTPGSGPVLLMTALAYAEPGKNVVTTAMGYTQLTRKFEARGGEVRYAPLGPDMGYDLEAMKALIDENTVIVYICNPNNPTGVIIDPQALKSFVLSLPPEILVFSDEAYLELADTPFALNTLAPLVKIRKNLIISRTFSKAFGMAGLRIGYGVAHPDVLARLEEYYMGTPTYLSAIAAQEALLDTEYMDANRKLYKASRDYTCAMFDEMGIEYARPQGAFIFFKSGVNHEVLRSAMAARSILISGSRETGVEEGTYADWARVSLGTKEQMESFIEALKIVLAAEA